MYNVDTGEITDIPSTTLKVSGIPDLPSGMVTEGVDIIVRVRASTASVG
jgi:Fur family iron response transcriptional regulator